MLLDPRQKLDNISVDSRVVGFSTELGEAEADDAVLKPLVASFTDERAARIPEARVLTALQVPGAHHVLRQRVPEVPVKIFARVPVYSRHHDLA